MHTVARHGDIKATKDPIVGRLFDAVSDKAGYNFPDLTRFAAQAEVFATSPWVNIAVSLIASTSALVNLNVFAMSGEKKTGIQNHDFEALMRRPNDHTSQFEFIYQLIALRRLTGNAYIYLSSGKGGAPDEMLLLRPDCVRIVPGSNGRRIDGYVYDVAGSSLIPLEPEQVLHWKRWHPSDPYYGLSDVQVIALSVLADKGMSTWQAKFFSKENAVPAGIVSLPPTISQTEYERVKSDWYKNYGGTQRATAIIRASDMKYQNIGTNHVDMDFQGGRLFEKEVILNKFGVPLSIFAVNANEANARAGMEMLTGNVVWPEMVELCQKFTAELMPFWGDNLIVEPDDIRVKDEKAELEKLQAYAPYKEVNEVRADIGLSPVKWGNRPATGAAGGATGQPFGVPKIDAEAQDAEGETIDIKAIKADKDCFVLLSLADDPTLVTIQDTLKAAYPYVTWESPADFHVTLVYATNAVDLQVVRRVLPKSINALSFSASEVGTFDSNGETCPVYLKVEPTPELLALQSGLAATFAAIGLELSGYSDPANWQPHITLGYMPTGSALPLYRANVELTSSALKCSIEVDDVHNVIYTTKALAQVKPQLPGLSRANEREIRRFATFAKKRLSRSDEDIDAIDGFKFNRTPAAYQILARAYGDIAQDADELNAMIDALCGVEAKAITPAKNRVSVSGRVDPLAKEKSELAAQLQEATGDYFGGLQQRIDEHLEHAPTSGFWSGEQQKYKDAISPIVRDALLTFTVSLAALATMQYGTSLDEAGLKTDAAGLFAQWLANIPAGIISTTKVGIDAIFKRWQDQPDTSMDDLRAALSGSYVLSDARAGVIAETETTRTGAECTNITAQDVAKALDVPFSNDDIGGPPAHGYCRCFDTVQVITDDGGNATSVDRVWHTVRDGKVCEICAPCDGKTFAEIAQAGLAA